VIRTSQLTKQYGSTTALAGVDLEVPEGVVFGLVGPNGAGKTTLIAILAGLRRASSGDYRIDAPPNRIAVLADTPSFDPWLTGTEIVDLARHLADPDIPASRVEEVLDTAGLSDVAARRVGGYSRGMLQRLGLAATVVGDPLVLLLDEPASALDPIGRREVLDLLAATRDRATVVFSSHILNDVEQVCDRVGVLSKGRLRYQGSLSDLRTRAGGARLMIEVSSPVDPVTASLTGAGWARSITSEGFIVRAEVTDVARASREVAALLASADASVVAVSFRPPDLESSFLRLMEEKG